MADHHTQTLDATSPSSEESTNGGEEDLPMPDAQIPKNESDSASGYEYDSDDEEAQLRLLVQSLETQLSANINNYDAHVLYIKALRKQGELEKLRRAWQSMYSVFLLTPDMWKEWAKDEASRSCFLDTRLNKQLSKQIAKDRLRVTTSIDAVRYLVFQTSERADGHPESLNNHDNFVALVKLLSKYKKDVGEASSERADEHPEPLNNHDNFVALVKLLSKYNEEVGEVPMVNDLENATYTSFNIQKKILSVWAKRVRSKIREDIGDSKFCIIVDESSEKFKGEQIGLILRFVDQKGFIRERYFDLVDAKDIRARTLKEAISTVLSRSCLPIQDIRGQGYDTASGMQGEWNELQALFCNECPSAYYVHCMAHSLQLALVMASKEVSEVFEFFENLKFIIKSCEELREVQATGFECLIEMNKLESGRGLNQIGTLLQGYDTRWSLHFTSVCNLLKMFGPVSLALENLVTQGANYKIRGDADSACDRLMSFDFVFILHVMKNIMGITDILCQVLQKETYDMANVIGCVFTTKRAIQELKENGWDTLIEDVKSFCEKQEIKVPDMSKKYSKRRGRSRLDPVTYEHHYRFEIFTAVADLQISELGRRFSDTIMELFTHLSSLDPRNDYASFDKDNIVTLARKFYPNDFTESELFQLQNELLHFEFDVSSFDTLKGLFTISELCRVMVSTRKSEVYSMLYRLICLVLTLPVSTATTERAFPAMKIMKYFGDNMEDDFLADSLLLYIEKEIANTFSTEMLINDFYLVEDHRVQL